MARTPNIHGGGARTNANGLYFEQTTSLEDALENARYNVYGTEVYDGEKLIGLTVPKNKIYSCFLEPNGIDYTYYNSKKWLPDECFIHLEDKVAYIIEKKFQNCEGSVDEKLPGCHFKKLEYEKLFAPLNFQVEYLYVFNDWFLKDKYKDTLEYIEMMDCQFFFNEIPLDFLGL